MERQAMVGLQRRILTADFIDTSNQVREISLGVNIPTPNFIFLGIEIFLAAGLERPVFTEFKGRAINTVAGTERGRQNEANFKCRWPPACRYSVKMSGVLAQRLGRKNSGQADAPVRPGRSSIHIWSCATGSNCRIAKTRFWQGGTKRTDG